jgi:hypothetical protein
MKKKPHQSDSAIVAKVIGDFFRTRVEFEGRVMSAREAMLLGVYNRSLNGDIDASIELQRMRDECIDDDTPVAGCLVLPESPPLEEFERIAYEQQAKFRERRDADFAD